jgi:hypothetical protein
MYVIKEKQVRKTSMQCQRCGSKEVVIYATCSWSYENQRWEFEEFLDGYDDYCHECDCETTVDEVVVFEDPPKWD